MAEDDVAVDRPRQTAEPFSESNGGEANAENGDNTPQSPPAWHEFKLLAPSQMSHHETLAILQRSALAISRETGTKLEYRRTDQLILIRGRTADDVKEARRRLQQLLWPDTASSRSQSRSSRSSSVATRKGWAKPDKPPDRCIFQKAKAAARLPPVDDDTPEARDVGLVDRRRTHRIRVNIVRLSGPSPQQILAGVSNNGTPYLRGIARDTGVEYGWDPNNRLYVSAMENYALLEASERLDNLLTCISHKLSTSHRLVLDLVLEDDVRLYAQLYAISSLAVLPVQWGNHAPWPLCRVRIMARLGGDNGGEQITLPLQAFLENRHDPDKVFELAKPVEDTSVVGSDVTSDGRVLSGALLSTSLFRDNMDITYGLLAGALEHACFHNDRIIAEIRMGTVHLSQVGNLRGKSLCPADFSDSLKSAHSHFDPRLRLSTAALSQFYASLGLPPAAPPNPIHYCYELFGQMPVHLFADMEESIVSEEVRQRGYMDVRVVLRPNPDRADLLTCRNIMVQERQLLNVPWIRPNGKYDFELRVRFETELRPHKKRAYSKVINALMNSITASPDGSLEFSGVTPNFTLLHAVRISPFVAALSTDLDVRVLTTREWRYGPEYHLASGRRADDFIAITVVNKSWETVLAGNSELPLGKTGRWTASSVLGTNGSTFGTLMTTVRRLMMNMDGVHDDAA